VCRGVWYTPFFVFCGHMAFLFCGRMQYAPTFCNFISFFWFYSIANIRKNCFDIIAKKYLKSVIFAEIIYEIGGIMSAVVQINKVEKAIDFFQQLSEKEKMTFYEEIKTRILINEAKRLDSIGDSIEMTDDEIVTLCRESRKNVAKKVGR